MNIKLVKINLRFIQKRKNQDVQLENYYPLVDGIIYQPVKWVIKSGTLSNDYLKNTSPDRAPDREKKTKLISEIAIPNGDGRTFNIVKSKEFFNDFETEGMGAVSFLKNLTGGNSNRHAEMFVKTHLDEYQGLIVGSYFQAPKEMPLNAKEQFKKQGVEKTVIIPFEDFVIQEEDYARMLNEKYFENIQTCSELPLKIVKNKNGQSKLADEIYKDIMTAARNEIKNAEDLSVENTGMIMAAFKKQLDKRFGCDYASRKCLICGLHHPNMLVASHIKARSESEDVYEKIDGNNGFWLCAQHDRAFDRRLVTFDENGKIEISDKLRQENIFDENYKLPEKILNDSKIYLKYHNQKFKEKFGSK